MWCGARARAGGERGDGQQGRRAHPQLRGEVGEAGGVDGDESVRRSGAVVSEGSGRHGRCTAPPIDSSQEEGEGITAALVVVLD